MEWKPYSCRIDNPELGELSELTVEMASSQVPNQLVKFG